MVGGRPVSPQPRADARLQPGSPRWAARAIGTATSRAGRVGHLDVAAAARHLGLDRAAGTPRRAEDLGQRCALSPPLKTTSPRSHRTTQGQPAGHKPRTRLLSGYEPDPVPPPTVCAKAQRTPPAEGTAVTASPRDGRGTADEGPRGQQVRKRRPPQPAQLGYLTRTPDGIGNRTGPRRAQPPVYIPRGEPTGPPSYPRLFPLRHAGTRPPHPFRGRSDACADAAARWVPRGCPSTPSGTHRPFWAARARSRTRIPHPAWHEGVRGLPDPLCRRRPRRNDPTPLRASLRDTLIGCHSWRSWWRISRSAGSPGRLESQCRGL